MRPFFIMIMFITITTVVISTTTSFTTATTMNIPQSFLNTEIARSHLFLTRLQLQGTHSIGLQIRCI